MLTQVIVFLIRHIILVIICCHFHNVSSHSSSCFVSSCSFLSFSNFLSYFISKNLDMIYKIKITVKKIHQPTGHPWTIVPIRRREQSRIYARCFNALFLLRTRCNKTIIAVNKDKVK